MYDKDGVEIGTPPDLKQNILNQDKIFYEMISARSRCRVLTAGNFITYPDERGTVQQFIEVFDDGYRFYFRYVHGRPESLREYQLTLWAEYKHSNIGCPELADAIMVPEKVKTLAVIG